MANGKIGVQMMMLKGKVDEFGVYETLRKVKELGYSSVEVSQIPMTPENVSELRRAGRDFGIEIAALSTNVEPMIPGREGETLATHFDKIVNDCKLLDCFFLRIGMLPVTAIGDIEKMLAFAQKADSYAERLKEHGISLHYHNHHFEFQKYDGEYLLDIIKNNTSYLDFELDVHWIQRGGENPAEMIKKYAGRLGLLHLKDYRISPLKLTTSEGFNGKQLKQLMEAFGKVIEFAEVGEGSLDMKGILDAGLASGVQHFFVEQDELYGRDPFDCLRTSGDNLKKWGYAEWF